MRDIKEFRRVETNGSERVVRFDLRTGPTTSVPVVRWARYEESDVVSDMKLRLTQSPTNPVSPGATVSLVADVQGGATPPFTYTFTDVTVGEPTPSPGGATAPPQAPTNLAATAESAQVVLTWTAAATDASVPVTSYKVYRGVTTLTLLGTTTGALTFTATGLTNGNTYTFSVSAVNGNGEGARSATTTATPTTTVTTPPPTSGVTRFKVGGYWEKPLPAVAPIHPQNAQYMASLTAATGPGGKANSPYLMFNMDDPGGTNVFSSPCYTATVTDRLYHVRDETGRNNVPDVFRAGAGGPGLRIPVVAKQYFPAGAGANDSPMLIYARPGVIATGSEGHYVWVSMLMWNSAGTPVPGDTDQTGCWQLGTATNNVGAAMGVWYTASYGHAPLPLKSPGDWPQFLTRDDGLSRAPGYYLDEPRNGKINANDNNIVMGRGCNAISRVVNYDRTMDEGIVNHVMEMFTSAGTADASAWPLTGYESGRGGIIPQGTRMRIRPAVNLETRLNGDGRYGTAATRAASPNGVEAVAFNQALAIAKGLKKYGLVIADTSGANNKIKIDSTEKQSRGSLWKVTTSALRTLPFDTDWEFIANNYDPPG